MPVLSVVQSLHHCVFQLMVLWVVRLLVFETSCKSLTLTWDRHYGEVLDGCGLDWHLPWFRQLMFVLGGLGPHGAH